MGKRIFIDGSVVATTGNLYAGNISCMHDRILTDCEYIKPEGGIWEVTEDSGSIFDSYYVRGDVIATGCETGDIYAFGSIFEFTVRDYQTERKQLMAMLDIEMQEERQNLFYQQQFVSAFSLLEHFLSCAFLQATCNCEEAYHKVWESNVFQRLTKKYRTIAEGPDCLEKELLYIDEVKWIVFHNASKVKALFYEALGIDVDMSPLADNLEMRNDIVHRFGHNRKGGEIFISKGDVLALLAKIDTIVDNTAEQMMNLDSVDE